MAKKFPRFLFSNSENTKSPGQYITHTQDPFLVVRVARIPNYDPGPATHNDKYIFFFQEQMHPTKKLRDTTDAMFRWLDAQEKLGIIKIKWPLYVNGELNLKPIGKDPNIFWDSAELCVEYIVEYLLDRTPCTTDLEDFKLIRKNNHTNPILYYKNLPICILNGSASGIWINGNPSDIADILD